MIPAELIRWIIRGGRAGEVCDERFDKNTEAILHTCILNTMMTIDQSVTLFSASNFGSCVAEVWKSCPAGERGTW